MAWMPWSCSPTRRTRPPSDRVVALPLANETVRIDLNMARELLVKWHARFEAGVPAIDLEGSDASLEDFLTEFVGEMRLVSAKCDALAEIMHDALVPR